MNNYLIGTDVLIGLANPNPSLIVSPGSLAFPSTAVQAKSPQQTVKFNNPNTFGETITSISITGGNANDFVMSNIATPVNLRPYVSLGVAIYFMPQSAGFKTASLNIGLMGRADLIVVPMSGIAVAASTSLTNTGAASLLTPTIPSSTSVMPNLKVTPTAITFPATPQQSNAMQQVATLYNVGNAPAVITSLSVTGTNAADFTLSGVSAPTTVPAGSSVQATIAFVPQMGLLGSRTAMLTAVVQGMSNLVTVSLSGTATQGINQNLNPNPYQAYMPNYGYGGGGYGGGYQSTPYSTTSQYGGYGGGYSDSSYSSPAPVASAPTSDDDYGNIADSMMSDVQSQDSVTGLVDEIIEHTTTTGPTDIWLGAEPVGPATAEQLALEKKQKAIKALKIMLLSGIAGGLIGGAAGAMLWKAHKFLGFVLGSLFVGSPIGYAAGVLAVAQSASKELADQQHKIQVTQVQTEQQKLLAPLHHLYNL